MNAYTISLIILAIISLFSIALQCKAVTIEPEQIGDVERLLDLIKLAESSNGVNKVGDNGNSLGIYQIGKAVLEDFNKAHNTTYPFQTLFDDAFSEVVAQWHIKQVIKYLSIRDMNCTARVVFIWNVGFSSMNRDVPKGHTNLIYDAIYQEYYRNVGKRKGK